jgi:peptidoglycan/LPS O-acetylase OafA/YrhL
MPDRAEENQVNVVAHLLAGAEVARWRSIRRRRLPWSRRPDLPCRASGPHRQPITVNHLESSRIARVSTTVRQSGAEEVPAELHPTADQGRPREVPGFVPGLDGLRGVAVLLVILYHFAPEVAPAGFLGVDVFFVLSGFLITRLLLFEAERTHGLRLGQFWSRRARRLLPALLLTVAGTCLIALVTNLDGRFTGLARDARASLFYAVNWAFIAQKASYFSSFETPSPLRHLWSLAIEEQFYLLWPLVLLTVYKLARRPLQAVGTVAALGALASAVLMIALFHPGGDPTRVYYGTDTRLFGVLIGAVGAVLLLDGRLGRRVAAALPILGAGALVAVLVAARRLSDHSDGLYRGGLFALSAAVGLLVLAVTVAPNRGAATALSWRPLRAVGVVSYGLYLYHWPVFVYVSERTTGRAGFALFSLRCVVTATAAIASYLLVERPIRERRFRIAGRSQAVAGLAVVAGILALTTALPVSRTLPTSPAAAAGPAEGGGPAVRQPAGAVRDSPPGAPPAAAGGPATPGGAIRILGVGDSVGFTFVYYWPVARTPGVTIDGTAALGCRLQDGVVLEDGHVANPTNGCSDWRTTWAAKFRSFRPDVVVLFATEWEVFDSRVDGHDVKFGSSQSDLAVRHYLDDLRGMVHSSGARLILVASPPITAPDEPNGNPRHRGEEWRVAHLNALYRAYAAAHPEQVSVLAMDQLICSSSPCSYEVDGTRVFDDGLHFDPDGMRVLAAPVLEQLRKMLDPRR